MGVLDFYTMLAGGVWVTKEVVKEIGNQGTMQAQDALVKKYVEEHTDLELEHQLTKMIEDPACYETVWERLETFKREHPVWCSQHEEKGYYSKWDGTYIKPSFGWQDIGKERLEFFENYGTWQYPYYSIYGRTHSETQRLQANRNCARRMLMQMHGKTTLFCANWEAREKYINAPARAKNQKKFSIF